MKVKTKNIVICFITVLATASSAGCEECSGDPIKAYRIPTKIMRDIVQSEINKKEIKGFPDIRSLDFYCRRNNTEYQGWFSLGEGGAIVKSYNFAPSHSKRFVCTALDSLSGSARVLAAFIYDALLKEGVRVSDVQQISISWIVLDADTYMKGTILLNNQGEVQECKYGFL